MSQARRQDQIIGYILKNPLLLGLTFQRTKPTEESFLTFRTCSPTPGLMKYFYISHQRTVSFSRRTPLHEISWSHQSGILLLWVMEVVVYRFIHEPFKADLRTQKVA